MWLQNTHGMSECLLTMFHTWATRSGASSLQDNRKADQHSHQFIFSEILQYLGVLENAPGEKHHQTLHAVPTFKSQSLW